MGVLPDPAELAAVAGRLGAHAAAAAAEAHRLDAALAAVTWRGPAASAFGLAAADVTAGLRRAAGGLDEAAWLLRCHAARVAATIDALRHVVCDGIGLAAALSAGSVDEMLHPTHLLNDTTSVLGTAGHAVTDLGHLVGGVL